MSIKNRPLLKLDANKNVMQWSYMDMAKRTESANGKVIYFATARPGSTEDEAVWRIEKYDWDGDNLKSKWPKDPNGLVSSQYEFAWSKRSELTFV